METGSTGGNFNGRLLKKNIVKKDGKDGSNDETYSLTKRGEFLADELIAKVKGTADSRPVFALNFAKNLHET